MEEAQQILKLESDKIIITDDDIKNAEKILLSDNQDGFDNERKKFIKNLETIDLQAVPGSGKTTALLAKLIILEKKLPFKDGSGILVLSHTNAAIDEIKDKIQHFCPRLFQYPNFVGTVQSFVDRFLAIPYFGNQMRGRPSRIDNEIFEEVSKGYFNTHPKISEVKSWVINKSGSSKVSQEFKKYDRELNFFQNLRFDNDLNIISNGINGKICLKNINNSKTYKTISGIKNKILQSGVLHYDDAYFLSERYLENFPRIKLLLQRRFSYVFVDEMQDMELHQYSLLEQIFFDNENSSSSYQRIGDKNQAIYGSTKKVKDEEIWKDREIKNRNHEEVNLRLKNSHRLSAPIAAVVCNFGLKKEEIIGKNKCHILPHILIYNDQTIKKVIPHFSELVKKLIDPEKLKDCKKHPIKAIAWNTQWENNDPRKDDKSKIRLQDYCEQYEKSKTNPKHDHNNLISYLSIFKNSETSTLKSISNNIINSLLKILRLEDIQHKNEIDKKRRYFSKSSLLKFLKEKNEEYYKELKLMVYKWTNNIASGGKLDEVKLEIIEYVKNVFLKIFNCSAIKNSNNFLNSDEATNTENLGKDTLPNNTIIFNEVQIELCSVHGVKGQTHCATLYLESYFQDDSKGNKDVAKSYESQRLQHKFLEEENLKVDNQSRVKQSTKMVYVGFSRATDLLCIAIHQDRYNEEYIKKISPEKWTALSLLP